MSIEFNMNQITRACDQLTQKLESITGTHALTSLLNPHFMKKHTKFNDLQSLFDHEKLVKYTTFEEIPDETMDEVVVAFTDFSSWGAMLDEAKKEYCAKQLNL